MHIKMKCLKVFGACNSSGSRDGLLTKPSKLQKLVEVVLKNDKSKL